jgi:hypothetical protein
MARRPIKVAAVTLANKIARMAWVLMVRAERFKEPRLSPAAKTGSFNESARTWRRNADTVVPGKGEPVWVNALSSAC